MNLYFFLSQVCHAIMNTAIWANTNDLSDSIVYTIVFPCHKCAQLIIQSRMKRVHYFSDRTCDNGDTIPAERLLTEAGIPFRLV